MNRPRFSTNLSRYLVTCCLRPGASVVRWSSSEAGADDGAPFFRYALAIQYHGGTHIGFSRQRGELLDTGGRHGRILPPSVESKITSALDSLAGPDGHANLAISSRTDRGVHALWNAAHVDVRPRRSMGGRPWDPQKILLGLNRYLPAENGRGRDGATSEDARVVAVVPAPSHGWSARYDATARVYVCECFRCIYPSFLLSPPFAVHIFYSIRSPLHSDRIFLCPPASAFGIPFEHDRSWRLPVDRLDVRAMNRAAKSFVGTHDFTSFRSVRCSHPNPETTIHGIEVVALPYNFPLGGYGGVDLGETGRARMVTVTVSAKSFRYRQVRNIVGCLAEVGRGRLAPEDVGRLLEARDRAAAPWTAPAHGLYLVDVTYEGFDVFRP
eukprot:CAMPEP_0194306684 /NCGR_PEP_ID=MMETSP0171-20130528/3741_1 /TAXON_ID=218684 /ORGANISM="Corethron pennatum, Strain L29A3" /LENGTH=382 /DNA_ID=CAMNT_0039058513 /DNA_START=125 /DNA_END=1273 /DNA_ORIENTATION=-